MSGKIIIHIHLQFTHLSFLYYISSAASPCPFLFRAFLRLSQVAPPGYSGFLRTSSLPLIQARTKSSAYWMRLWSRVSCRVLLASPSSRKRFLSCSLSRRRSRMSFAGPRSLSMSVGIDINELHNYYGAIIIYLAFQSCHFELQ